MNFLSKHSSILILLLGSLAALLNEFYLEADKKIVESLLIVIVFGSILLLSLAYDAYKSFQNTDESPAPKKFWSFIFNKLPTPPGINYTGPASKILIVGSDSKKSKEQAERIIEAYQKQEKVVIEFFKCNSEEKRQDGQEKMLNLLLEGNEAIVLFRTIELENGNVDWVYEQVENWLSKNSHVPCLVIDLITPQEEKDFIEQRKVKLKVMPQKFNTISLEDPLNLPWRLLSRANDRAFGWRKQAASNRRIGFLIFFFFLAAIAFNQYTYSQHEKEMRAEKSKRGEIIFEKYLSDKRMIKNLFEHDSISFSSVEKVFDQVARSSLDYYLDQTGNLDSESLGLSYWIQYSENDTLDNDEIIYQLGWTQPGYYEFFLSEDKIVSCAFRHPYHFVYWKDSWKENISAPSLIGFSEMDSLKQDSSNNIAVWHKDEFDKPVGFYSPESGKIEFQSPIIDDACLYVDVDATRFSNLLCISLNNKEKGNICGVCLEDKKGSTSFLIDFKTQSFLLEQAEMLIELNSNFLDN